MLPSMGYMQKIWAEMSKILINDIINVYYQSPGMYVFIYLIFRISNYDMCHLNIFAFYSILNLLHI